MWIKPLILAFYSFALVVCTEEQFASRRNLLSEAYSAEDGNNSGRNRSKRTLSGRSYCRLKGCCPGRDDGCALEYYARNATCYCDDFCTSGPPDAVDCCPDFWTACHGRASGQHPNPELIRTVQLQQVGCFKGGQHYGEGTMLKDNCNSCKCVNSNWKCSDETCLVQPSLIKKINNGNYGWKASNYSQFWGMSLKGGFHYRLGTLPPSAALLAMRPVTGSLVAETDFPEFFVAWYEWPGWIHDPLDQRNCAASWAFSTASVAADRLAIHSKGHFTDNLSPQHLISCDTRNQHGCKGGSIHGAWSYLKKHGLVSHVCYPLFWHQPPTNGCAFSSEIGADGKRHATRPCPNNIEPSNHIYQCGSPYRISSQETDIMKEIKENGPVQAVMQVYDDFFLYKSGIYKHSQNAEGQLPHSHQKKTHSVKIVGWGALQDEEGRRQKFWVAANSWGRTWGENGYFRILRGQNECDIEKLVIAVKCHL
ncbi:tubulointerstitial nephritis antigen [Hemicordylus capensis]|uniref:tubulointerstitial nephritis antigen n=1 Tax=Hemicordylus capensis TaxID=884348 RepID=UPI0023024AA7|nr:tubulointerstitial nephritis antigen [Hemicordylus capensis]